MRGIILPGSPFSLSRNMFRKGIGVLSILAKERKLFFQHSNRLT